MSTYVDFKGFLPPTEDFLLKHKAYMACIEADVEPPRELSEYFDWLSTPDNTGIEYDQDYLIEAGAVREWKDTSCSGYEIVVENIPEGVSVIRVYVDW